MARILIIDDNETMREGLGATVRRMGHEAVLAASGADGLTHVSGAAGRPPVEFVITDLKMEGIGGLDVVKAVRERDPDCPVMIVTAFGTVETAVEAMRLGAWDFLQKPFAPEVVRLKVARALELRDERRARERAEAESAALRADAAAPYRFDEIVGETPAMRARVRDDRKGRAHGRLRLHHRRIGNRQGAGGARDPRALEARAAGRSSRSTAAR